MKKLRKYETKLRAVPQDKGESIEEMLRRLTANKEPIPQNVPPIYTPKDEGVLPDYDIRADRQEVACDATDKFAASEIAKGAQKATPLNSQEQAQKAE